MVFFQKTRKIFINPPQRLPPESSITSSFRCRVFFYVKPRVHVLRENTGGKESHPQIIVTMNYTVLLEPGVSNGFNYINRFNHTNRLRSRRLHRDEVLGESVLIRITISTSEWMFEINTVDEARIEEGDNVSADIRITVKARSPGKN
jgi:hypothetical protein